MKYVRAALLSVAPLSFVALGFLVVLAASRSARRRAILMATTVLLWLAYLAFIGGDIFPGYRHIVPVVVVLAYALVEGVLLVQSHAGRLPKPLPFLLSAAILVLFLPYLYVGVSVGKNQATMWRWVWEGQVTGLLLKDAFAKEQPLIAVSAAGTVPYWSELPALDMLGLNDYYLPRHPPQDKGRGRIGHELGDAGYVLRSKPDMVIFNAGVERAPIRTLRELQTSPEFLNSYVPVRLRGMRPREYIATVWVRKFSEKIGISQSVGEIRVPGFLLSDNRATAAYLSKGGRLVVSVSARDYAGVRLELDDGAWEVDVDCSARGLVTSRVERGAGEARVILTTTSADPIEVRELVLRRSAAYPMDGAR